MRIRPHLRPLLVAILLILVLFALGIVLSSLNNGYCDGIEASC